MPILLEAPKHCPGGPDGKGWNRLSLNAHMGAASDQCALRPRSYGTLYEAWRTPVAQWGSFGRCDGDGDCGACPRIVALEDPCSCRTRGEVIMGNWRTVNIVGTIALGDLSAARAFVNTGEDWDRFHPLCNYGFSLCGLGDWVGEEIQACGNLSERDYSVEAVADTLRQMAAAVPSLRLKVHCGDQYESAECIATITVEAGAVSIGAPEVERLSGLDDLASDRLASFFGVPASVSVEETPQ